MQNNQLPIAALQSKSVQYVVLAVCIVTVVKVVSNHFGIGKDEIKTVAKVIKETSDKEE